MNETFKKIFTTLNDRVETQNKQRREIGSRLIQRSSITILGQTSLLIQEKLTYMLSLAQTGDLDAKMDAEYVVKENLKEILPEYGLLYDEDSELIFIPKNSKFNPFMNLSLVEVKVIDPESALVSKAVKAPQKNIQLIRQAIASESFVNLAQRIIDNGGDLKKFI